MIKNSDKINKDIVLDKKYYNKHILRFIQIPFKHKGYYEEMNRGVTLSSYIYEYIFYEVRDLCNDKLFWFKEFTENNINTPNVVAYTQNGVGRCLCNIQDNKIYIEKPTNGTLGFNVFKVDGKTAKQNLLKKDNILVQEILNDCIRKKATSYRYVTTYEGEEFNLIRWVSGDNKSITSNVKKQSTYCENYSCFDNSQLENRELRKICKQLSHLHKTKFDYIFVIGWDIMINCENNTIKAYCLEGNLLPVCWDFPNICSKEKINYLNNLAERFYIEKGIVSKNYFN